MIPRALDLLLYSELKTIMRITLLIMYCMYVAHIALYWY